MSKKSKVIKVYEIKEFIKDTFWDEFFNVFASYLVFFVVIVLPFLMVFSKSFRLGDKGFLVLVFLVLLQGAIFDLSIADNYKKKETVVKRIPKKFEMINEGDKNEGK